jgi:hypothetical protein
MKSALQAAVEVLSTVLEQENAALSALDLVGAGRCLATKRIATDALVKAGETHSADRPSIAAAMRLRDLAAENRRLLEHAIAVQGRVIAVVARAMPRSTMLPRYAAGGMLAYTGRPGPVALSARA